MHREPIIKIFAKGFGFMLFGNILSGIMTISLAPFIGEWYISYIALLFTVFIYASLLFTAGMRDGQREKSMLKNKRVESCPKYRWIKMGLILWAVISVPCIVLALGSLGAVAITGEFLFAFRFICGAVYPLMHIVGIQGAAAAEIPLWFPLVCIGIYLVLTPISAQTGYKFGFDEKSAKDYMYEK